MQAACLFADYRTRILVQNIAFCKLQEEALHAFVKPEVLEGSNQYYCEKCKKKQNALKVCAQEQVFVFFRLTNQMYSFYVAYVQAS